MKIILTGATGNLGYELAVFLKKNQHTVIPILRRTASSPPQIRTESPSIINNLLDQNPITFNQKANLIIHCAGNVNFNKAGNSNQIMTKKLITLAKKLEIPIIYISTAYIYRPMSSKTPLNNQYEIDKYESEQLIISSGIKYSIFRPSVLVGNSISGKIQNFSGFYNIAQAFYLALNEAKIQQRKVRFPVISSNSNLVPVDQAAQYIVSKIETKDYCDNALYYIVNNNPPDSTHVLKETLNYFKLTDQLELIDISFGDFQNLDLSVEEQKLFKFVKNYYPYWVFPFDFPTNDGLPNLITHDFLYKTLTFFSKKKLT